jgi:N,N'-diacetyllegionaminate synthase
VALGARIIEKHFTLSRSLEGPDHKASLEPDELKAMISGIRKIELALGNMEKYPSKEELSNVSLMRKSIVASKDIKVGEIFSEENLTCKRPFTGKSPMEWDQIIGTKASKNFFENEQV